MASAFTVGDYYTKTRNLLDVSTTDLPDDLLATFLQEGFDRIIARKDNWKHLSTDETFTTVAEQGEYTLSEVTDLRQVLNVTSDDAHAGALQYIAPEVGESIWVGPRDIPQWPTFWSYWNGTLRLWPTPDAEYDMKVRGYRDPEDFIAGGAGTNPDLPDKFHAPLWYWVVSRAYLQQEDPESSAVWQQSFEEAVSVQLSFEGRAMTASPLVLHGSRVQVDRRYEPSMNRVVWSS